MQSKTLAALLTVLCIGAVPAGQALWAAADRSSALVGVYYFPGWTDGAFVERPKPWEALKRFPEKTPQFGYYQDRDPVVLRHQLQWMASAGINYVVFDWYANAGKPLGDQAIEAYRAVAQDEVRYTILWCNAGRVIRTDPEWRQIVTLWLTRYAKDPRFLKIGDRPVIFIQAAAKFSRDAEGQGRTAGQQLAWAQTEARKRGLPGIFFVAGLDVGPDQPQVRGGGLKKTGFEAVTVYNYGKNPYVGRHAHGYLELDRAYRANWQIARANSPLPYVVPMISGWDRRPWGGSADPGRDPSISTAAQFAAHLEAGKAVMTAQPVAGQPMGVICCWNEYGEGSYVEPTKGTGTQMLDAIRQVFGAGN